MRAALLALLGLALPAVAAAPGMAPAPALEEKFVINAQYRNGINKTFRDLGHGAVQYRRGAEGRFGLSISGSMKNPETADVLRIRVNGEFRLSGRSIVKISQKLELNDEARRYEQLMTENLPFVWLARFQELPPGPETDDVTYRYEGRDYRLRYVRLDDSVEATLFQSDLQIGKFFLEGRAGSPPQALAKARMVGPDHLVLSLVIEKPVSAPRGE